MSDKLTPEERKEFFGLVYENMQDNWEAHDDFCHIHEEPSSDMFDCENKEEHEYLDKMAMLIQKVEGALNNQAELLVDFMAYLDTAEQEGAVIYTGYGNMIADREKFVQGYLDATRK